MTVTNPRRRDLIHLMKNQERLSREDFIRLLGDIVDLRGCGWELGPDPVQQSRMLLSFSVLGDPLNIERIREEMSLPIVDES